MKGTIFYIYLILFILSLLIASLSWYFNKYYLPKDFETLGKIKGTIGAILRISTLVLTCIHWILLCFLLYLIFKIYSINSCFDEQSKEYMLLYENALLRCGMWIL